MPFTSTSSPVAKMRDAVAASLILSLSMSDVLAAGGCTTDAMIVFDGSGSMSETGFNQLDLPRIVEARQAVQQVLPKVSPVRRLGLLIYGPGPDDVCSNIDLRFAPEPDAGPRIIAEIEALAPAGSTPLSASVRAAAEVLEYRERPGVVVLVTDGKETCGGSPCQLAVHLASDAQDLVVHVIGFKVRGDHFSWGSQGGGDYTNAVSVARCLADATGGGYFRAETVEDLANALAVTLGCPNLSQTDQRPGQRTGPDAPATHG